MMTASTFCLTEEAFLFLTRRKQLQNVSKALNLTVSFTCNTRLQDIGSGDLCRWSMYLVSAMVFHAIMNPEAD
jgi:hypothetical protein